MEEFELEEQLPDLNVLAVKKGEHRYAYIFTNHYAQEIAKVMQQHAEDPELNLTKYDSQILSQRALSISESSSEECELEIPERVSREAIRFAINQLSID